MVRNTGLESWFLLMSALTKGEHTNTLIRINGMAMSAETIL